MKYLIILISLLFAISSVGQESNIKQVNTVDTNKSVNPFFPEAKAVEKPSEKTITEVKSSSYSREEKLSLMVLIFGLIFFAIQLFVVVKIEMDSEHIVTFMSTSLLIISSLYLISAGWSSEQIAPAIGLLGTIAGYLLGRNSSLQGNKKQDPK